MELCIAIRAGKLFFRCLPEMAKTKSVILIDAEIWRCNMQEVFKKIIERLNYLLNHFGEHCEEYGNDENGNCRARICQI